MGGRLVHVWFDQVPNDVTNFKHTEHNVSSVVTCCFHYFCYVISICYMWVYFGRPSTHLCTARVSIRYRSGEWWHRIGCNRGSRAIWKTLRNDSTPAKPRIFVNPRKLIFVSCLGGGGGWVTTHQHHQNLSNRLEKEVFFFLGY